MGTRWQLRHGEIIYPLVEGISVIGRSRQAGVPLDDGLASRRHAEIEVNDEGVFVRDLGSRNGVIVAGRRLDPEETYALEDGDQLLVGETRLVVVWRGRDETPTLDAIPTAPPPPSLTSENLDFVTGAGVPYETFLNEAERAMGQGDEAKLESSADLLLETLSVALQQGLPPDAPAVDAAIEHALYLAAVRDPTPWLVRLLRVLQSGRVPISIRTLSRIERIVTERGFREPAALWSYVRTIRPSLEAEGPRGRALLGQLERLHRQTSADQTQLIE